MGTGIFCNFGTDSARYKLRYTPAEEGTLEVFMGFMKPLGPSSFTVPFPRQSPVHYSTIAACLWRQDPP